MLNQTELISDLIRSNSSHLERMIIFTWRFFPNPWIKTFEKVPNCSLAPDCQWRVDPAMKLNNTDDAKTIESEVTALSCRQDNCRHSSMPLSK